MELSGFAFKSESKDKFSFAIQPHSIVTCLSVQTSRFEVNSAHFFRRWKNTAGFEKDHLRVNGACETAANVYVC